MLNPPLLGVNLSHGINLIRNEGNFNLSNLTKSIIFLPLPKVILKVW